MARAAARQRRTALFGWLSSARSAASPTASNASTITPDDHYIEPGWLTRNVLNRAVGRLTRHGVSMFGSRELRVVGRRSGAVRTTVVNLGRRRRRPLPRRSPRDDAVGPQPSGRRHGTALRRPSVKDSCAEKLLEDAEAPVLTADIARWGWKVGQFFEAVGKDPSSMPSQRSPRSFPCSPLSGSCRRLRVRTHRWLTPLG